MRSVTTLFARPSHTFSRDENLRIIAVLRLSEIGRSKKMQMMNARWTAATVIVLAAGGSVMTDGQSGSAWRDRFAVSKANLLSTGTNSFITMQPGRILKLIHGVDTLTVTILPDTQVIDGVTTGVLEERETKKGELVEVSRNFMATDKTTGDVYYFGEDVDIYKNGKITGHESAWRAGTNGARFGLMIPARPTVGDKFYQEIAPRVAMDRVEVVSAEETVKTPAGLFEHCIHLRETTPLERDVSDKYYAPGIGIIKDDEFELAERPLGVR